MLFHVYAGVMSYLLLRFFKPENNFRFPHSELDGWVDHVGIRHLAPNWLVIKQWDTFGTSKIQNACLSFGFSLDLASHALQTKPSVLRRVLCKAQVDDDFGLRGPPDAQWTNTCSAQTPSSGGT